MAHVELTEQEWQQVIAMIAMAPWREANPLLMKIGQQLQTGAPPEVRDKPAKVRNGKEAVHVE